MRVLVWMWWGAWAPSLVSSLILPSDSTLAPFRTQVIGFTTKSSPCVTHLLSFYWPTDLIMSICLISSLTVNFLRTVSYIFSFSCCLLLMVHFSWHVISFQKVYWTIILTQGTGSGLTILGMKISLMTNISRVDSDHKPRFWSQRAWLNNAPYWLSLSFFICTAREVRVSTSYGYIIWITHCRHCYYYCCSLTWGL